MTRSITTSSRRRFLQVLGGLGVLAVPAGAAPALGLTIERYAATLPGGYGARAVLKAGATWQGGRIVLVGRALEARDRAALEAAFSRLGPVDNRMEIFPFKAMGERAWGAVRASGTDLRAEPDAGSELVSQALPGDTLKVLARSGDGRWYQILREWDGYVGWIPAERAVLWTEAEWQAWQSAPRSMLMRSLPGLPRGSIVAGVGGRRGRTAEGQEVTIPSEALRRIEPGEVPTAARVVELARVLLADQPTRYLWGGTLDRALDCSGFNQTVYRMAGGAIPRDSYQQQAASRPVAPRAEDWRQLAPGDLLFFSEKRSRATHTGIYVGDGRFIHASSHNQGIAENHLMGEGEYERFLRRIYFGAGRVV
ncbi:C40 family peptidase [Gloeobacter morelensis]|uniref:C40 family peptidase n=1 Tax=Gloeobacter morelensis MG652769 TaxID=2781736 RepID=A0ABY3PN26_9CYAN|nr:SH3 domain-containing C40 family peptidase [Gloeobacter morelensis]UFP95086.1 C40 family peptidase [Gloeobacter morelensis MG652769]